MYERSAAIGDGRVQWDDGGMKGPEDQAGEMNLLIHESMVPIIRYLLEFTRIYRPWIPLLQKAGNLALACY